MEPRECWLRVDVVSIGMLCLKLSAVAHPIIGTALTVSPCAGPRDLPVEMVSCIPPFDIEMLDVRYGWLRGV